MAERGMDPFFKAFKYFIRSLRPSVYKKLTNPGVEVGQDLDGNKFYEIPADPSRGKRFPSRYFKPIGNPIENFHQEISPEWNAWLRRQRDDPPRKEEVEFRKERLDSIQAQRLPKKLEPTTEGNFPKFPEYEDSPGTKYN